MLMLEVYLAADASIAANDQLFTNRNKICI